MRGIPVTEQDLQVYRQRLSGTRPATIRPENDAKPVDKAVVLLKAILAAGLPGVWYREFTFHETRGHRLDCAAPDLKAGVEIDGAVHRIKGKFARDMEKHNLLMAGGWRWVRCTPAEVDSGQALDLVRTLLQTLHS